MRLFPALVCISLLGPAARSIARADVIQPAVSPSSNSPPPPGLLTIAGCWDGTGSIMGGVGNVGLGDGSRAG